MAAVHCRLGSRGDVGGRKRDALTALLGEAGFESRFNAETGYVAPRLGILADGTWWFLVLDPGSLSRRHPSGGCVSLRRA